MTRAPAPHAPPLMDPADALALARAVVALEGGSWSDRRAGRLYDAARALVLLLLEVAADSGDPALLDALVSSIAERGAGRDDDAKWQLHHLASHHASVAPSIDNALRDAARLPVPLIRSGIAAGLSERAQRALSGQGDATDDEARAIVQALTRDADVDVRATARQALGGYAETAWAPYFSRNPLDAMPADRAAALRGPLDAAAAALEIHRTPGLKAALDALPDELALPLLDAWMRLTHPFFSDDKDALLARWTQLDTDASHFAVRVREGDLDRALLGDNALLGQAIGRLPEAQRVAFGTTLAELLVSPSEDGKISRWSLGGLLAQIWPEDRDPSPLLDIASRARADPDDAVYLIERVLSLPAITLALDGLVDQYLARAPGMTTSHRVLLAKHLAAHAHPRLRAEADVLVRSGDEAERGWALHYLLGAGHDRARDPSKGRIAVAALDVPALRPLVLGSPVLRPMAGAELRKRLRAARLTGDDALLACWDEPPEFFATLPEKITAILREAREAAAEPREAVHSLPPVSMWTERDWAWVERAGATDHFMFALALGRHADAALVPLLERWLAASKGGTRRILERALQKCRGELSEEEM